jgi:hypothetical protein
MVSREIASDRLQRGRAGLAGFVSGYLMLLAGYWFEAILGVSELDFARAGVRYASGGRQGWWFIGILFHFIDSVLLGILFAAVVWLILAMLIAMPFMGSGPFAWKTGSPRPALASLGLHVLFGSVLGAIYGWHDAEVNVH